MESLLTTVEAGGGVILPHDLVPDDNPLYYSNMGHPVNEMMSHHNEELEAELGNRDRFIGLAVRYYNDMNGTDYLLCHPPKPNPQPPMSFFINNGCFYHCGFYAAPTTDVSAIKFFHFDINRATDKIARCDMLDGLGSCDRCHFNMPCTSTTVSDNVAKPWSAEPGWEGLESLRDRTLGWDELRPIHKSHNLIVSMLQREQSERSTYRSFGPDPSEMVSLSRGSPFYSVDLAMGVSLSDRAKLRLELVLPALAYYNKKQHTNYKLVDALPYCTSLVFPFLVAHGNFIAREGDSPNKLFFAEHEKHDENWVVVGCRVVRGKTTAGCHQCSKSKWARQVIHPTC